MPNFLTTLLVLVGTVLGVTVAFSVAVQYQEVVAEVIDFADPRVVLGILFGGIGYLVASTVAWEFQRWFDRKLPTLRMADFIWGCAGTVVGLVLANLFMLPALMLLLNRNMSELLRQSPVFNVVLPVTILVVPLFLNVFVGYLGMTIFVRKQSELVGILSSRARHASEGHGASQKVLDTSVIIDGRIVDLLTIRIIEGPVSVPQFVLNELTLLADSSDAAKRLRGKRGFEILEKLKVAENVALDFPQRDYPEAPQVDAKLILFAKELGATIVTNDFALNKLARLQEIQVINLNEVSNSLRPVVLAGEKLEILVAKRGTGPRQGVGYLNDGTMVVVEGAADSQGQQCLVTVTNVQQSSVGRMVFASLDTVSRA